MSRRGFTQKIFLSQKNEKRTNEESKQINNRCVCWPCFFFPSELSRSVLVITLFVHLHEFRDMQHLNHGPQQRISILLVYPIQFSWMTLQHLTSMFCNYDTFQLSPDRPLTCPCLSGSISPYRLTPESFKIPFHDELPNLFKRASLGLSFECHSP